MPSIEQDTSAGRNFNGALDEFEFAKCCFSGVSGKSDMYQNIRRSCAYVRGLELPRILRVYSIPTFGFQKLGYG